MYRYFIKLAYNGANFHGWQIQDNAHTVQAELNDKMSILIGESINLVGCGRTDTGVHAREFYAHFDISKTIDNTDDLLFRLNGFLHNSISVFELFKVANDLHARFDAKSRTYSYFVSRVKDPFSIGQEWHYRGELDIEKMNKACRILLNHTDFTSFSKLHTQTKTNNCKIYEAKWKEENHRLIFTIRADRFLRNMVRAIVGTMMEIGSGKLSIEDLDNIITAKDRSRAGFSAPAEGLFLDKVEYDFTR